MGGLLPLAKFFVGKPAECPAFGSVVNANPCLAWLAVIDGAVTPGIDRRTIAVFRPATAVVADAAFQDRPALIVGREIRFCRGLVDGHLLWHGEGGTQAPFIPARSSAASLPSNSLVSSAFFCSSRLMTASAWG